MYIVNGDENLPRDIGMYIYISYLVPSLLDLHMFYFLRPILFRTCRYFTGLCSSNIPRYFLDFAKSGVCPTSDIQKSDPCYNLSFPNIELYLFHTYLTTFASSITSKTVDAEGTAMATHTHGGIPLGIFSNDTNSLKPMENIITVQCM